jgi:hypothetical protein
VRANVARPARQQYFFSAGHGYNLDEI